MILIVDDNPQVLLTLSRMLEVLGHKVIAASSPYEALRKSEEVDRIDLVVSDISLPGMDGFEMYREMRRQRPGIKTLFISGYLDPQEVVALDRNISILQKPVSMNDLQQQMRILLSQ